MTAPAPETDRPRPDIDEPRGLTAWVDYLTQEGMPAFARTAQRIAELAEDEDSSIGELARLVLQDAAMTSRLLRLANSPVYGQFAGTINTVTRAVIVLGFDAVRDLCLSLALIEDLGGHARRDRVLALVARTFHAAVQARGLAKARQDPAPEEIFVATLLHRIGELAFWSLAGPQGHALAEALGQRADEPAAIQREVLGFTLEHLTRHLIGTWRLGGLVRHVHERARGEDPRITDIHHGQRLASLAEAGWERPEMQALLAEIADTLGQPYEEVVPLVENGAREAAQTIGSFGAPQASALIPLPGPLEGSPGAAPEEAPAATGFPEPDPQLQLTILQEITAQMGSGCDLGTLLGMVLEGINRGIGMDRTLFALVSPDRRELRARHALGPGAETLQGEFRFSSGTGRPNLFLELLQRGQALWLDADQRRDLAHLIDPATARILGETDALIAPIQVRGKTIGLLYADRRPSGRPLSAPDFNAFRHFAQQAGLVLSQPRHG